jgi:hypothetical protein
MCRTARRSRCRQKREEDLVIGIGSACAAARERERSESSGEAAGVDVCSTKYGQLKVINQLNETKRLRYLARHLASP